MVVLHQQNAILNFTNFVDSRKVKFGQNIKLSMPDHILLHSMHLLYIYLKVIYEKVILQLITIVGVVFTPTRHN